MKNDVFRITRKVLEAAQEQFDAVAESLESKKEVFKLEWDLSEKKDKLNELYTAYGKAIYHNVCDKISKLEDEIEELEDEIEELSVKIQELLQDEEDEAGTIFCSRCGREYPSDENFCSKCGKPLNKE